MRQREREKKAVIRVKEKQELKRVEGQREGEREKSEMREGERERGSCFI